MKCGIYAWIFIFILTLRFNEVPSACTGSANEMDETASPKESSVCLDIFVPLMSYLSAQASKFSKGCTSAAAEKRANLLSESRSKLASAVRRIHELLLDCDLSNDSLRFFSCMKDIMDEVMTTLEDIGRNSTKVIEDFSAKVREIEKEEKDCLEAVIQNTKLETDQIFADYKECLSAAAYCCCKSSTLSPSSTSSSFITSSPSSTSSPPSTSSTSSTSSTKCDKDNDQDIHIQARSTRRSVNFIAVIVVSVVLVIVVLIATYLCRKRKRCSSEDDLSLTGE